MPEDVVILDDVLIIGGRCPPVLSCNFEDSVNCGWRDMMVDGADLPWSLGSGSDNITTAPGWVFMFLICLLHIILKSCK